MDLRAGILTFPIAVPGETFLPTAAWGYDAGGVTPLDFADLTYTGSAVMEYDGAFGIDNWYVSQGTGTVAGFLTPTGAGSAGPFVGTTALGLNPLVAGSCRGAGGAVQFCNITIGAYTSFGVDVNGEERWFSHGVRMTVSAPEPTPVLLVGFGLAALLLSRQRRPA